MCPSSNTRQSITPLSVVRLLFAHDLFAFETRALAALLGLRVSCTSRLLW